MLRMFRVRRMRRMRRVWLVLRTMVVMVLAATRLVHGLDIAVGEVEYDLLQPLPENHQSVF